MGNVFILPENTYYLRNFQETFEENRKTARYELRTISNRTPSLWSNFLNENILETYLNHVKWKIKSWKFNKCMYRLYKNFQQNLVFLENILCSA